MFEEHIQPSRKRMKITDKDANSGRIQLYDWRITGAVALPDALDAPHFLPNRKCTLKVCEL